MHVGQGTDTAAVSRVAAADHAGARARRAARAHREDLRAKSGRIAVVLSLFLVLLAAALLIGGRVVIDPVLQSAAQARGTDRVGAIVYATPDGMLCRHLSFDNVTAELTEGAVEKCADELTRGHKSRPANFAWGH
jgi:hypothetical protein